MDSDESMGTPKEISHKSYQHSLLNQTGHMVQTPTHKRISTSLNTSRTPNAMHRKSKILNLLNAIGTPPAGFPKIINPFEASLTERLHLPTICSPSLFKMPSNASTPRHSSTLFEWTIEDVSSLNPANVEAHETQFMSITDPELEARAQAAISSFFKEQAIVPSPIDCPLRKQKLIIKSESTIETEHSIRRRDGIAQTILSLPPILPKHIEDALKPFFNYTSEQQQSPIKDCDIIDHDARNASLCRKLFNQSLSTISSDDRSHHDLEDLSPQPKSPDIILTRELNGDNIKNSPLNMSTSTASKGSFGYLSPISNSQTPINRLSKSNKSISSHLSTSSIYQSTPERPRSVICRAFSDNSINMSINVTNNLSSTSAKRKSGNFLIQTEDGRLSSSGDSIEYDCDEEYVVSQSQSSSSSQHATTPNRRKFYRRVNRKNLSHSFLSMSQDDNAEMDSFYTNNVSTTCQSSNITNKPCEQYGPTLCQTDSGFSESENQGNFHQLYALVSDINDIKMQTDTL